MIWLALVVGLLGVWKLRPRHLGNDVLKVEVFKWLHGQNKRNEDVDYEDLERKWLTRFTVTTLFVSGFTCLSLASSLGISMTASGTTSLIVGIAFALLYWRRSKVFRTVTLPLYATLCRIPQARWDIHQSPQKWMKVDLEKGRILIRLPKDWHMSKVSLKMVTDLINSRVEGTWIVKADTRNFLLTYTREVEAETVPVDAEEIKTPTEYTDFVERAEFVRHMTEETEIENDPW